MNNNRGVFIDNEDMDGCCCNRYSEVQSGVDEVQSTETLYSVNSGRMIDRKIRKAG